MSWSTTIIDGVKNVFSKTFSVIKYSIYIILIIFFIVIIWYSVNSILNARKRRRREDEFLNEIENIQEVKK